MHQATYSSPLHPVQRTARCGMGENPNLSRRRVGRFPQGRICNLASRTPPTHTVGCQIPAGPPELNFCATSGPKSIGSSDLSFCGWISTGVFWEMLAQSASTSANLDNVGQFRHEADKCWSRLANSGGMSTRFRTILGDFGQFQADVAIVRQYLGRLRPTPEHKFPTDCLPHQIKAATCPLPVVRGLRRHCQRLTASGLTLLSCFGCRGLGLTRRLTLRLPNSSTRQVEAAMRDTRIKSRRLVRKASNRRACSGRWQLLVEFGHVRAKCGTISLRI